MPFSLTPFCPPPARLFRHHQLLFMIWMAGPAIGTALVAAPDPSGNLLFGLVSILISLSIPAMCDVVFAEEEWQAVYIVAQRKSPPEQPPPLDQMVQPNRRRPHRRSAPAAGSP